MQDDYRRRIYSNYAAFFKDAADDRAAQVRWGRAYSYYFRRWLPSNRDAAILDLACGSGRLMQYFRSQGYCNVTGVDASPVQVEIAREAEKKVIQDDALKYLEAQTESFDLIVGLDIIEHLKKDEALALLDGCFKALRPSGRLILQTPNADSPYGMTRRYGDLTHEICVGPELLECLLRFAGFSDVCSREQGPVPWGYSLASSVRFVIWQGIRTGMVIWNLAEIGSVGSGKYTRVFCASGIKTTR